jgi:hypothetical protein
MWTGWAQANYPPHVVDQVVQAAMNVLAAGGSSDAAAHAAALAEREVKKRERLAATRAHSVQVAEAEATRRAAAEAKAAEVTQAKAARRAAGEAKTSQAAEAKRGRTAAAKWARAQTTRGAEGVLTLTPEQARLVEAARLRERLAAGDPPPRLDPGGIVLRKDEALVAREPATLWEFRGQGVQYRQGGALFFGSPLFLIGSLAASAAVSGAARSRARRAAAAQWRSIDSGFLLLTTQRLSFMGAAGWRDIPFTTIRAVECEVDALALHCDGAPPFRVAMEYPEVMFILLNHVAWGHLPDTHLPPDLAERVERAETMVTAGGPVVGSGADSDSGPMVNILARRSVIPSVDVNSALGLVRDALTQRRHGRIDLATATGFEGRVGSRAAIRLKGGWMAATEDFPLVVVAAAHARGAATEIRITVADDLGYGMRTGIQAKYAHAAAELADALVSTLTGSPKSEVRVAPPPLPPQARE